MKTTRNRPKKSKRRKILEGYIRKRLKQKLYGWTEVAPVLLAMWEAYPKARQDLFAQFLCMAMDADRYKKIMALEKHNKTE